MFESLKNKYGTIGQDIVPNYANPIDLPKPVSYIPEPTPLGEPTKTPRFSSIANKYNIEPQFGSKISEGVQTEKPTPTITERLTNQNIPIISSQDINSRIDTADQWISKREQEANTIDPQGINQATAIYRGGNAILRGALESVKGLKSSISMLSEGLGMPGLPGGLAGGEITPENVAKTGLGGFFTVIQTLAPESTLLFNSAVATDPGKKIMGSVMDLGTDTFKKIAKYVPGLKDVSPENQENIFNTMKLITAGLIWKGASKYIPETNVFGKGTKMKPIEEGKTIGATEKEYADILNLKPGQSIDEAFKKKSMETHPDRPGGSNEAQQQVNEAYTKLKEQGFRKGRENMSEQDKSMLGEMIQKATTWFNEHGFGLSTKNVNEIYDQQGNQIKPKTKGELESTRTNIANGSYQLYNRQKHQQELAQEQMQSMKVEGADYGYSDALNASSNIVNIANRLNIDPEAMPTGKLKNAKDIEDYATKLVQSKKISPIQKVQSIKDLQSMVDSQNLLEKYSSYGDVNQVFDRAIEEHRNQQPKKSTKAVQQEQINNFFQTMELPTDPNALSKLQRVLNGEKVKDNGVDYNKVVEQAKQKALDNFDKSQTPQQEELPDFLKPDETLKKIENKEMYTTPEGEKTIIPQSTMDRLREIKDKQRQSRVTKTSNNLYHTTPIENIESIKQNGLTTGNKPRYEGVSGEGNIYFSANEEGARYFGQDGDVMIRTKTSYKPKTLEIDLLGGGEGTYSTKDNISPNDLQIKYKSKWYDLKDFDIKKLQEKSVSTVPQKVPQETVDWLVDKFKVMVSDEVKNKVSKRMKGKVMKTVLQRFSEIMAYQPKVKDIKEAYKDPKILYEALKLASGNVLDKAEQEVMRSILQNIVDQRNKSINISNTKDGLSSKQKAVFLKWEDFKTPIKGIEDIKIKIDPLNKFIKENPGYKIHVIETPTIPGKKPFAMMGTKENTYPLVMRPHVLRAIAEGKNTYIEPYGGVGTSLYYLPEYFRNGLQQASINMFDIEKYTIVKAIKEQRMDVEKDVTNAYDTIIQEVTDGLMQNEEFQRIYNETRLSELADDNVGSKEFRESVMLLGFHPALAKEFFRQKLDAKVAVNGELTDTFKQWIGEQYVEPKVREKYPDLEGTDLQDAISQGVDEILSKPGLFEKQYAEMSKSVRDVLDKYDSNEFVNSIAGDHNKALLVAVARHFRQRGVSGQRLISPSDGFNSVEGVKAKMIETLGKYDMTMKLYGDRINLYNQDGQEFINDRSYELRQKDNINNSVWYFDPPYVKSNKMYIKNNPDLRFALGKYSDYEGIKDIFRPALGDSNTLLFTNDVDGNYFQSLKDLMGDRMDKNIYTYKEGLTPTSFITTSDVGKGMRDNQYMYYALNKNAKIMDAVQFIDKLGGDIAQGLKKNIAKLMSYISPEMQKNMEKLERIRTGMERAEVRYEELVDSISQISTGKEKQDLLREAKEQAKKGYLTGKPLLKLIDAIQKNMADMVVEQKVLRSRIEKFQKSDTMDAGIKKAFFQEFNKEYTTRRISQEQQKELGLKSIYSLSIDEINELNKMVKEYSELARSKKFKSDEQKQAEIDYQIQETKDLMDKQESKPLESEYTTDDKLNKVPGSIRSYVDQYLTFGDYMFERLGMGRIKKQVDFAKKRIDDQDRAIIDPVYKKIKEYNMKHENMQRIGLYGLMNRGDGLGEIKVFTYLTKMGNPLEKLSGSEKIKYDVLKWKRKPLTEEQALKVMDEIKSENFLTQKEKRIYDMMREGFDKAHKLGAKVMLEEKNKIIKYVDNYRPIVSDRVANKMDFVPENYDMTELQESLTKRAVSQTLDKKATAKELIPIIEAQTIFSRNIRNTIYYSEMQPVITKLSKVVKTLGKETLGTRGYDYFMNKETGYLQDLLKQGRVDISSTGIFGTSILSPRWIEKMQSNFAKSILLANPSTILKQLTNVFDTAIAGEGGLSMETIKKYIQTNGAYGRSVLERSTFLKNRMGHDRIQVLQDGIKDMIEGKVQKIENFEGMLLNAWDMTVGITINDYAYREGIKQGLSHKDAQYRADQITKRAIGSFEHTDLPQVNKQLVGYKAPLRMFQTFVMNRYNLVRYKTVGEKVKTTKMIQNIALLLLAGLAEAYIGYLVSKKIWGVEKEITPGSVLLSTVKSFTPVLGNIVNTDMYGNVSFAPLNIESLQSLGQGVSEVKNYTSKTLQGDRSVLKYIGNIIKGLSPVFGIPGGQQIGRGLSAMGEDNKSSSKFKTSKFKSNKFKQVKFQ